MTPLQAMLKNLAVIIRKADEMLKSDVPIDDRNHLAVRKMLREIAFTLLPSALVHRDQPELDPEAEAIVA